MRLPIIHICLLTLLLGWVHTRAQTSGEPLRLRLDHLSGVAGGLSIRSGEDGSLFLLDRSSAVLYRIDPASGSPLWKIDGSETGDEFIDPAWLSSPDGFYIFLTDRGTRRVWRVDYRGELRGAIELSLSADPVLLELAVGGQLLVYDRASGMLHLLDDSGRGLWAFPPGEGRISAEPARIAIGPAGHRVFILWRDSPHLTVVSLSGRNSRRVNIQDGLPGEVVAMAVAGTGEMAALALVSADGCLYRLDTWSGKLEEIELDSGVPADICGDSHGFTVLTGPEPVLWRLELEGGR